MPKQLKYKDLHRWSGHDADNAHCGLVQGIRRRRILGCGKLTRTKGFWYKNNGTISTVHLCPSCARKVK